MEKHTGYGTLTLTLEKNIEGKDQNNALHTMISALNNYSLNLNDIKLVISGEEIKLNDFDIEWESIQEEEIA